MYADFNETEVIEKRSGKADRSTGCKSRIRRVKLVSCGTVISISVAAKVSSSLNQSRSCCYLPHILSTTPTWYYCYYYYEVPSSSNITIANQDNGSSRSYPISVLARYR